MGLSKEGLLVVYDSKIYLNKVILDKELSYDLKTVFLRSRVLVYPPLIWDELTSFIFITDSLSLKYESSSSSRWTTHCLLLVCLFVCFLFPFHACLKVYENHSAWSSHFFSMIPGVMDRYLAVFEVVFSENFLYNTFNIFCGSHLGLNYFVNSLEIGIRTGVL